MEDLHDRGVGHERTEGGDVIENQGVDDVINRSVARRLNEAALFAVREEGVALRVDADDGALRELGDALSQPLCIADVDVALVGQVDRRGKIRRLRGHLFVVSHGLGILPPSSPATEQVGWAKSPWNKRLDRDAATVSMEILHVDDGIGGEVKHELPTSAAGSRGTRGVCHDRDFRDLGHPGMNRAADSQALGAEGQPVRGTLDVCTGKDPAIRRLQGSSDLEV